jgi:hypothetical protein
MLSSHTLYIVMMLVLTRILQTSNENGYPTRKNRIAIVASMSLIHVGRQPGYHSLRLRSVALRPRLSTGLPLTNMTVDEFCQKKSIIISF